MEGGCTCGKVRYRLTARPLIVHCCHCRWCQHLSGSAFVLNAWIEASAVALLGDEPEEVASPAPSGNPHAIARCPSCAVTLWGTFGPPVFRFVRVGTLDTPGKAPPDVHIYTSTKAPWLTLGDAVPVFAEYYRRSEVWHPESIARFKAARDAAG